MSVIAAIHDSAEGVTWIGSDTAATMGSLQFDVGPKFRRAGKWAIGATGEARIDTLIRRYPEVLAESDTAIVVANKIRELLISEDFKCDEQAGSKCFGSTGLIIADSQSVYSVCAQFSVDEIRPGDFWATGAGYALAMGAAHALDESLPRARLRAGIQAAISLNVNCGGEVWIDTI